MRLNQTGNVNQRSKAELLQKCVMVDPLRSLGNAIKEELSEMMGEPENC